MKLINFGMSVYIETEDAETATVEQDMACFHFKAETSTAVVRMATSLISNAQAKINFHREVLVYMYL